MRRRNERGMGMLAPVYFVYYVNLTFANYGCTVSKIINRI